MISDREVRARRLFNYMMQTAINEDRMNKPGRASSQALRQTMEDLTTQIDKALHAGSKAPLGQGFDATEVAVLAARIAGHAYALARNEGVLNDLDLEEIGKHVV